jgi:alkanesulfonate monooxygenase SsuD/methylene tetrahydromethanopterin reductase-like flavin-dependent oxidoreductase (luciferase family)
MEFGILFTSRPNAIEEPYPHRDVHARVTDEIIEAERLGYDTAWIAEHVIPPFRAPRGATATAG